MRTPEQKKNNQGEVDILFAPLALFMRYQMLHDRAYERTLKNLLRLRKERITAERGSVSQKRAERAGELRENRENGQAETHKLRTATAEIRFEAQKLDFSRKVAAAGASDFGKIAA